MGFHRQGQPTALDRNGVKAIVTRYLAEEIALAVSAPLERTYPVYGCLNPAGHNFRADCGSVACAHCRRLAWA